MIFNLMDLTLEVNALVFGWRAESYEIPSLQLLSGRAFRDGQPEIMLGDFLASNLNKKPGDTMELQGFSLHGGGDLSRRVGAGGGRGSDATGSAAADQWIGRKSLDVSHPAAPRACGGIAG